MKAIIDVAPKGSVFHSALAQAKCLDAGQKLDSDYHLSFESAKTLFSELTPARIALLKQLRGQAPLTVYGLAKLCGRNYSNVHTDIAKLLEHGLVSKNEAGKVHVPFDSVEIHLTLAADQILQ